MGNQGNNLNKLNCKDNSHIHIHMNLNRQNSKKSHDVTDKNFSDHQQTSTRQKISYKDFLKRFGKDLRDQFLLIIDCRRLCRNRWTKKKFSDSENHNKYYNLSQEIYRSEEYAGERRIQVHVFNLILILFLVNFVVQDFKKINNFQSQFQQNSDSSNSTAQDDQSFSKEKTIFQVIPSYGSSIRDLEIASLVIKSISLIVFAILSIIQIFKLSFLKLTLRLQGLQALILYAVMTHLQFEMNIFDALLTLASQYIVLPLVLLALSEQWLQTIIMYFLVSVYPFSLITKFERALIAQYEGSTQEWSQFFAKNAGPVSGFHSIALLCLLYFTQRARQDLFRERKTAEIIRNEYNEILQNMPEGVLIVDKLGSIQFANKELREVMNMEEHDMGQESHGLYVKMFRRYNFNQSSSAKSTPLRENETTLYSKDGVCQSNCLHTLIEDQEWEDDNQGRLYELDKCTCELPSANPQQESRVFTQIKKLTIQFREKPATMLLIRNITTIISYEKQKTEGKYQELLTGTISHEMLTPLNTIINLSTFVEMKLLQQVEILRQKFAQKMRKLEYMEYGGESDQEIQQLNSAINKQQTPNFNNENYNATLRVKDSRKSKRKLLGSQLYSNANQSERFNGIKYQQELKEKTAVKERSIQGSLDYMHMVRSSANILQYLVKQMIDLNNIRQNRFTANIVQQDLDSLYDACQDIIDCYSIQAKEKNIYLRLQTAQNLNRGIRALNDMCFDRQRYQQVLINLVQNGVKFTAKGGVDIIIDIEQQYTQTGSVYSLTSKTGTAPQKYTNNPSSGVFENQINKLANPNSIGSGIGNAIAQGNIKGCGNCGTIVTRVKDSGIGIKQEVVNKLFKLFGLVSINDGPQQQNGGIITTQGIGLGLSISKQLIEQLGGKIRINTSPGNGTEVVFILPFQCGSCSQVTQSQVLLQISPRKQYVKTAENNPFNRGKTTPTGSRREESITRIRETDINQDNNSPIPRQHDSLENSGGASLIRQPFGIDFSSIFNGVQKIPPALTKNQNSNPRASQPLGVEDFSITIIDHSMFDAQKNSSQHIQSYSNFNQSIGDRSDRNRVGKIMEQNSQKRYSEGHLFNNFRYRPHINEEEKSGQSSNFMRGNGGKKSIEINGFQDNNHINILQRKIHGKKVSALNAPGDFIMKFNVPHGRLSSNNMSNNKPSKFKQYAFNRRKQEQNQGEYLSYNIEDSNPDNSAQNINEGISEFESMGQMAQAKGLGSKNLWRKNDNDLTKIGNTFENDLSNPNVIQESNVIDIEIQSESPDKLDQTQDSERPLIQYTEIKRLSSRAGIIKDDHNMKDRMTLGINTNHQMSMHQNLLGLESMEEEKTKPSNMPLGDTLGCRQIDTAFFAQNKKSSKSSIQSSEIQIEQQTSPPLIPQQMMMEEEKERSKKQQQKEKSTKLRRTFEIKHLAHNHSELVDNSRSQQRESSFSEQDLSPNRKKISHANSNNYQNYQEDSEEDDEVSSQHLNHACNCDRGRSEKPHIMIVDDNMFNLIPLEMILREFCGGLSCDKANNGEEAVNLFRDRISQMEQSPYCQDCGGKIDSSTSLYQLIFMDIQMPVMDGYEATRQILNLFKQWKQANPQSINQLHVVAVTSFTNDEAFKTCYQVGMSHVINKPVNVNQIKQAIEKYCHQNQEGQIAGIRYQEELKRQNQIFPGGF